MQADTIVPNPANPQSLNRFSYVLNNPVRYTDPTGHRLEEGAGFEPDPNYWRDLTWWLVREVNQDAASSEVLYIQLQNQSASAGLWGASAKAVAYHEFYMLVRDSGPWDFRDQIRRNLGESIRLGGQWFEYSTPGNISYGLLGRAAGFTGAELHGGASIAQIRDYMVGEDPDVTIGGPETLFDTSDDFHAVEFGIQLYEKHGPDVTIAEFNAMLVSYGHRDKLALSEPPAPSEPRTHDWPYWPGYFNGPRETWPSFVFPSFRR